MIEKIKEYKNIILNLLKLSLPILGGNISQVLIGFADTICAGHYSTLALGAISVASAILMTITIGAIGLLLSISPVIANYRGKKIPAKRYLKRSLKIFARNISQFAPGRFSLLLCLLAKKNFCRLMKKLWLLIFCLF